MRTKLTLRVDKEVIELAKKIADERKTSVSRLFEEHIALLGKTENPDRNTITGERTQFLKGILKK